MWMCFYFVSKCICINFFWFHIKMVSCYICPSLSDLPTQYDHFWVHPSMLLQMTLFSFLWLNNTPLYVCMYIQVHMYIHTHTHIYIYHIFFSHSSEDGQLSSFHVLAIVIVLLWTLRHVSFQSFLWIYAQQWDFCIIW